MKFFITKYFFYRFRRIVYNFYKSYFRSKGKFIKKENFKYGISYLSRSWDQAMKFVSKIMGLYPTLFVLERDNEYIIMENLK